MSGMSKRKIDPELYGVGLAREISRQHNRKQAIEVLIAGLTDLGVVIFYTDDSDERRETEGLDPDVPIPVNPQ